MPGRKKHSLCLYKTMTGSVRGLRIRHEDERRCKGLDEGQRVCDVREDVAKV